ncbi:MFS monosaccharide transporter [Trametes versicolor FP-101664 SS1]|uniref:MFS monosaccharide transporter n=1 Tax=Trametes versicolor (strain FP-101664) TaxID=717944 RepID=UPI0004624355|nr:MFS monosaccharide transporter [Trametes versicolor FP-101664 SS1]EIW53906.1 MFS monosaccharide transporter [Trametes versicolor FP-101664 SS1]
MATFASFGGILLGYDTGSINGILQMPDWLKTFGDPTPNVGTTAVHFSIATPTESLVVSILSAGTFLGALGGAPVADITGRRTGILISCVVFCLGVALQTGASTLPTFIAGRFFAGFGVGLISTLVPMYQSECSPKWIRGAVVSCWSLTITVGLLLASVINNATKARPDHGAWRIPIAIQFVWAFILFVGMLCLPETPRWLMKENRESAASKSLSLLTGSPPDDVTVQTELKVIREALRTEDEAGERTYRDCFRLTPNRIALRTLTSIVIHALQQLSGITFIFYYGTTFFANAGIKNPFLVNVIVNIVNMCMTLPGIWGADKLGRRPLLIWGAVVMCVCAYLVAILGAAVPVQDIASQRAVIALVCIYIAAFAATWGPLAWVVGGEIFPHNIRAKAVSLSVASHWIWNWAISFAAPYLVNSGKGNAHLGEKVFFIWGSMCAACVLFACFCIPETKGLSLEQVDVLYQHWSPGSARRFRTGTLEGGAGSRMEKAAADVDKKDEGSWELAVETIPVLDV